MKAKRRGARFLALFLSVVFILTAFGFAVPEISTAAAEAGPGGLSFSAVAVGWDATVTLTNETGEAIKVHFLLAIYDETGKLLAAESSPLLSVAAIGEVEFTFEDVLGPLNDTATCKIFCWDENFVPLSPWGGIDLFYFPLVRDGVAADVYVDTNGLSKAFTGIKHAAENLTDDIAWVTDVPSVLRTDAKDVAPYAVIAGNIGESPIIDGLIEQGKLDVSEVEGKWESYVTSYISNPMPGVKLGLVIAGSDKRGTIFGIYKISETIGVSAFSFFADSVPIHQDEVFLKCETTVQGEPSVKYRGIFINDERSTERWLEQFAPANDWTEPRYHNPNIKYNGNNPQYEYWCTHEYYEHVFDMILRQYGNYLWPAMWKNTFWNTDPLNGKLANDWGVVIGTSHQEHMNTPDKEWNWQAIWYVNGVRNQGIDNNYAQFRWINQTTGAEANKRGMIEKWTESMEATKDYETIPTMGLRGPNDTAIWPSGTQQQNIDLLNDVIREQRNIIRNVFGHTDVPQAVVVYKEVEGFYYGSNATDPNSGWKASIEDEVTVILCDDNHGNLRTLPTEVDRGRKGGFGIYYHFDYNGSPRSYRWMDATPGEKIREQMLMAYDYGIDRIWITNVGDIKFNEPAIDYWFKLAYDVEKWGAPDGPEKARRDFAAKEFGEELADDIAEIIAGYVHMNGIKKGENVFANTFSRAYFDEADRMLAQYKAIADSARAIKPLIPADRMDAYYNLVYHPALISHNAWNTMLSLGKNQVYGNASLMEANKYGNIAVAGVQFDNFSMFYTYGAPNIRDATYSATYADTATPAAAASSVSYIKTWLGDDIIDATTTLGDYYCVADGKYYGFFPRRARTSPYDIVAKDPTTIDGNDNSIWYLGTTGGAHRVTTTTTGNQFAISTTSTNYTRRYVVTAAASPVIRVLPQPWAQATTPQVVSAGAATSLAAFTDYVDEQRYFDVGTTGNTAITYTVTANQPWIIVGSAGGTLGQSPNAYMHRVGVSIDWSKLPAANGLHTGSITVQQGGAGTAITINVTAEVFDTSSLPINTFVETPEGYISMLSTSFAASVAKEKNGVSYQWTQLPHYGREFSSMKVAPTNPNAGYGAGKAHTPGLGGDSPYLEYNVYLKTSGTIDIITQWAPTTGMDPRQISTLQYAVQLDSANPLTVNTLGSGYSVGSSRWGDAVESNTLTVTGRSTGVCVSSIAGVAAGQHTIRIYMVNDGLVLQKVLVGTSKITQRTSNLPTMLVGSCSGTAATLASAAGSATSATLSSFIGPPESFCTRTEPDPFKNFEWVGTWGAGQYYGDTSGTDAGVRDAGTAALTLPNSTLRQMIRTSVAGDKIRLRFSNEYGATPMVINAVSLAKANGNPNTSNIDVSTNTPVTFSGGEESVTIPPGQFVTSDTIDFPVAALERNAVSIYFGSMPTRVSLHVAARCSSYIQRNTNSVLSATVPSSANTNWFSLCNIDVLAPPKNESIVVIGDSITDGYGVSNETYTRWVDALMNNLQGNPETSYLSVINMGIGTNALLTGTNPLSARGRFARDVLNQPKVGYVVFQIGVNDLPGSGQVANNMIAAFDELYKAAAAQGIKVIAGTITPRGSTVAQDANRQTVNTWIRKQYEDGNVYGLADFDALLRSAAGNTINAPYNNDGIHPNAAGYKLMGDYVYSLILKDFADASY